MPARKRTYDEVESSSDSIPEVSAELSTLKRIRGMWEFAAFMQYLFFFGRAVKCEDFDVEDFEDECLKPGPSEKLSQIALALLKNVSSHKGLTPDLLDEYTRRQYVAKAPKRNPFGEDDEPKKFAAFDVFTKVRVLNQLAVWTLHNPVPIREKLALRESEELEWRIEPFGWDAEDRVYFVLDDNRLYRRTDRAPLPDLPPATPKKGKGKAKGRKSNGRNTRSAKKPRIGRRVIETSPEETELEEEGETLDAAGGEGEKEEEGMDDFYMTRWELIAVSMDEYDDFIDTIRKSRDANEKALVKSIQEHVMPVLLEAEEERKRKEARRMKELELLQKMATSKRSSRLADKQDKIKAEREAAEAEAAKQAELDMAHREQRKQAQMEEARESRRETREQRLKEREVKRILEQERLEKEQEMLAKIETEGVIIDADRGRISERQLKADMAKRKKDLENLQVDDSWYFDCVCGIHGPNLDDGSHSIACEKCSTWQHSKCNGISEQQAERDDFHFVCQDCVKKEQNPVPKIKLKVGVGQSPQSGNVKPAKGAKVADGVHIPVKKSTKSPKASKTNGSAGGPMVYPGPPPPAPGLNGAHPHPQANGQQAFQWHAYQPPQAYRYVSPSNPGYQGYPPNPYAQQSPRPAAGPSSPTVARFNHETPATYAPQYSPPRQPAAYAPRPTSQGQYAPRPVSQGQSASPRPAQPAYQSTSPRPAQPPYQGYVPRRPNETLPPPPGMQPHSPSAPRPAQPAHPSQPQAQAKPPNTLPPLGVGAAGQAPGSPTKRPLSSGFNPGPSLPPPPVSFTNGAGAHTGPSLPPARPTSSHAPPPTLPHPSPSRVTPAPAPRAPVFTPNSSFSASHASQGQTPFNAAPGYSPTKQASPKIGGGGSGSPGLPAASPVVSPPNVEAARFSPSKQATTSAISPLKHASSPAQAPPAAPLDLGPSPNPQVAAPSMTTAAVGNVGAGNGDVVMADAPTAAPAKDLVNPVAAAPQLLPPGQGGVPPPQSVATIVETTMTGNGKGG